MDEANGRGARSEGDSEPTQLSIDRQRPKRQTSTHLSATANTSSEPAPLTWYASLVKSHSPTVIPNARLPSPVLPPPWTSTESSQTTSPKSSLPPFPRLIQPHESPPTRAATSTTISSSSATPASGRHQSIPISFLIHPISESPQRPTSLSPLPSSLFTSPSSPTNQSERKLRDYEEYEDCDPSAIHKARKYPPQSSRPSRSPSVDPTKFSSAAPYAHRPNQHCWGPSESEQLRDIEIPRLQRHDPMSFSDQAPTMTSCTQLKNSFYTDADGDRCQAGEKEESASVQSNVSAIEGHVSEVDASESALLPKPGFDRRAGNPNLKTTKTGKIRHKSRKIGVSKKSTAYNRFLQQRSKVLAEQLPNLTPQQRMKQIAEEWAVSEKNQHKTRRKSRFLGPTGELTDSSTPSSNADASTNPAISTATATTTSATTDIIALDNGGP